ncbi:MAG: F0F1 ATP synthase subunit A [Candidatus Hydrogenedentes bacterium]|nr:F0F1 ATP synthase subunit A [Candidatus Hydrogenedentota bacterium]
MEHLIERFTWHYVPFTDYRIPLGGVNVSTIVNTLLVMALLLGLLRALTRRKSPAPGRGQALVELLVEGWDKMYSVTFNEAEDPHYEEKRRRLVPYLSALFIFILISNAIVALPVPFVQEPTSDLNCTLALGFLSITCATIYGFHYKGVRGTLKDMAGPLWESEGAAWWASAAGKASALLFFPIHVIGEISRMLSVSFRLFGNILGGATIIAVIFLLARGLFFPLILDSFFLAFEAAIQAYVFSMLTLVYIAVATE